MHRYYSKNDLVVISLNHFMICKFLISKKVEANVMWKRLFSVQDISSRTIGARLLDVSFQNLLRDNRIYITI